MALLDIGASVEFLHGLGAMLSAVVTTVVVPVVFSVWRAWTARKKAEADVDKSTLPAAPTHPLPTNPFGHPAPTDPALLARLDTISLENALQRTRWTLDDLRRELEATAKDHAKTAAALSAERRLKDRLVFELECEQQKVASLVQAKAVHEARIAALEAEREALENRLPTPMRPPRGNT